MFRALFSNRLFMGVLVFFVLMVVCGTLYMRHVERQTQHAPESTRDTVKWLNEPKQAPPPKTDTTKVPESDTSQGGHWHGDEWHSEPHETPSDVADRTDGLTVKDEQLTEIEMHLIELGYDITKLPRDPNGELLRGPGGEILLVPNPTRPTTEQVLQSMKDKELRERLNQINGELSTYQKGKLSPERASRLFDLKEERLRLQQALGIPVHTNGQDPFVALQLQRLLTKTITENTAGFPVSEAPRIIELFRKLEMHDAADDFQKASTKALENKEQFFKFTQ